MASACWIAVPRGPWARRRKVDLADLANEAWLFFPEDSLSNAYIREGFRVNGVDLPAAMVSSFSMQLRFHLLAKANFVTVLHGSVLAFNAKPWSLRALPIDLRIAPMPIAIFTLKNRTLSPVVQLFVDNAREVAKKMANAFV